MQSTIRSQVINILGWFTWINLMWTKMPSMIFIYFLDLSHNFSFIANKLSEKESYFLQSTYYIIYAYHVLTYTRNSLPLVHALETLLTTFLPKQGDIKYWNKLLRQFIFPPITWLHLHAHKFKLFFTCHINYKMSPNSWIYFVERKIRTLGWCVNAVGRNDKRLTTWYGNVVLDKHSWNVNDAILCTSDFTFQARCTFFCHQTSANDKIRSEV